MKYIINRLDRKFQVLGSEQTIGYMYNLRARLLLEGYFPLAGNVWAHTSTGEYVSIVGGLS